MNKSIDVIGTYSEDLNQLNDHLKGLLISAESIAAPQRVLNILPIWWKKEARGIAMPECMPSDKASKMVEWLKTRKGKSIVIASGDPLWFGIGRILLENFKQTNLLQFHPCPSSMQVAFSRLKKPWQNSSWVSLHGREPEALIEAITKRPEALTVLTDPSRGGAGEVIKIIIACGLIDVYQFWICERLGSDKERIMEIINNEDIPKDLDPLHLVVLIRNESIEEKYQKLPLFGIEDGVYAQHSDKPGLMTKKEVRVQLLSDLELPEKGVIWDIGAGVGSIGLEAIRIRKELKLLAIEKRVGGLDIIKINANKLNVNPSELLEGEASYLINNNKMKEELSKPDRVIIGGGTSNEKDQILRIVIKKLNLNGIIIIPLAILERIEVLKNILEENDFEISLSQHSSSRGLPLGDGTRLSPINPIIILKGKHSSNYNARNLL